MSTEVIPYIIYSDGGGEQLYYVFNAVAVMFGGSIFMSSLYITAMLSGVWILMLSISKNDAFMPIKYMFWFWIASIVILQPKTEILIKDPVTKYQRKVDNVPYILGMFAGTTSGIGHAVTSKMEDLFTIPAGGSGTITKYHKYSEYGSVFASRILKDMNKYRIKDGRLKENMSRFIDECVVLESLRGGRFTVQDLNDSKDIWGLVRDNANPILGFPYRYGKNKNSREIGPSQRRLLGDTDILTCKKGAKELEKDLNKHIDKISGYFGRKLISGEKVVSQEFGTRFKQELQNSYEFMSGIASQAEDILRQQMLINEIDDAAMSYATAKATIQQRSWHLITGELASNFLIALKIVLECLAYGGFIFIGMMAMLPGGMMILGKYLQLLIWLQLWAPLYAILNMIMSTVARSQMAGVVGDYGLTMVTSVGISNLHENIEAVAAMCSASIPFISYSLMQGGVSSFMHLAGSMTSAMSGAASTASSEITSGNLALNSVAYQNRSMWNTGGFKNDVSARYDAGRIDVERNDGSRAFATSSGGGGLQAGAGFNTSKLPMSLQSTKNLSKSINDQLSDLQSTSANLNKSFEQSQSLVMDKQKGVMIAASKSIGNNHSWSISENSNHGESITTAMDFNKSLQDDFSMNSKQSAEIMASLGAGLSVKAVTIGANSSFSSLADKQQAFRQAEALAKSQGITQQIQDGVNHLQDVRFHEGKGKDARLTENLQSSVNDMQRASEQISLNKSKMSQLTNTQNFLESSGIGISEDKSEKFINHIDGMHGRGRGYTYKILANPNNERYRKQLDNAIDSFMMKQSGYDQVNLSSNMQQSFDGKSQQLTQDVNKTIQSGDFGAFNQEQLNNNNGSALNSNAYAKNSDIIDNSDIAQKNNLTVSGNRDRDLGDQSNQIRYDPNNTKLRVQDEIEQNKRKIQKQKNNMEQKQLEKVEKFQEKDGRWEGLEAVKNAINWSDPLLPKKSNIDKNYFKNNNKNKK